MFLGNNLALESKLLFLIKTFFTRSDMRKIFYMSDLIPLLCKKSVITSKAFDFKISFRIVYITAKQKKSKFAIKSISPTRYSADW